MIIGFDASRAFINKRTGTENYAYQILKNLAKIDQTNTYIIYICPNTTPDSSLWPDNFHFKVIPYPRLWTQIGLAAQTFIDRNLDILFIPSHTLPLIHRSNLKTVVTVHDLGAEYLPSTHQLKQRLYLNFMTHHQLQSATHLIAVSQATKKDLEKRVGIRDEKVSVIYEGYNQTAFKPLKSDALVSDLSEFGIESNKYFLFVGTIQPRKNLIRLIRAYSQFLNQYNSVIASGVSPKADEAKQSSSEIASSTRKWTRNDNNRPKLVLAGSKGWMSDEIYALPKKLGIENQVKFLGYVPDEKLPALYSGAEAFIFPSLFEGFGLPVLEAMACGCPVITSNTSSLPEVAGNAALLIDPQKEDEITQAISKLYNNPKLKQELIQKGFEQVKKFTWEKAAQETLQVLEKVTQKS